MTYSHNTFSMHTTGNQFFCVVKVYIQLKVLLMYNFGTIHQKQEKSCYLYINVNSSDLQIICIEWKLWKTASSKVRIYKKNNKLQLQSIQSTLILHTMRLYYVLWFLTILCKTEISWQHNNCHDQVKRLYLCEFYQCNIFDLLGKWDKLWDDHALVGEDYQPRPLERD